VSHPRWADLPITRVLATWERGEGRVLTGVGGIPYYRETNSVLVADKITAIDEVLAESN
jgi:hypothetical protein